MEAPDKWLYEYAVIRYVPRIDRGEFINIGLLMMNKRLKWLKGKVMIDQNRIIAFHPSVDLESLRHQTSLFERNDVPSPELPTEEKYRWLTAEKSAMLQVSPSHPGFLSKDFVSVNKDNSAVELMEEEFQRLFSTLVL